MAIDDPQEALETQLAAEERTESLLTRYISRLTDLLNSVGGGPTAVVSGFGIASGFIERERAERKEC